MNHICVLNLERNQNKKFCDKTLIDRATGRFYTHRTIVEHLTEKVASRFRLGDAPSLRIIDPFCGDGRLVMRLLEKLCSHDFTGHLKIDLWDCDADAVEAARISIFTVASTCGIPTTINAKVCDSFAYALGHFGEFDIVITNPPWDAIKPDRRELSQLNAVDAEEYVGHLKSQDAFFVKNYSLSQPKRKFAGWGTNLARVGVEVSLRLLRKGGVCGIVTPASIFADQVSGLLRKWLLSHCTIYDVGYYPAESKFFKNVDQESAFFVSCNEKPLTIEPQLTVYDKDASPLVIERVPLPMEYLSSNDFALPSRFGVKGLALQKKMEHFQTVGDLEGKKSEDLWLGRELDETGWREYLAEEGKFLFAKGKMVERYAFSSFPRRFVRKDGPKIPKSALAERLVWRDVSRPSQKRRMRAAIVPTGWVTGNSLHVGYFKDKNIQRLKALLVIFNSLVFEMQIRSNLATSHISLGAVRRCKIPSFTNSTVEVSLAHLADRCIEGDTESMILAEVLVAKAYGLNKNDFKTLVSLFSKISSHEVRILLDSPVWNND